MNAVFEKLGKNQKSVLINMQESGGQWTETSGWTFGGVGNTVSICEGLERKGIVRKISPNYPFGFEIIPEFTDAEIEAAARVLYTEGRENGWFKGSPTYDEMANNDPIGKSEFDGIVERMLRAAKAT